jgi:diaminohydroxyphosphoribosylaminopyrimidine deaminase/5-amino-6-(5-phosphoribosylamino)uracil reductase
VTLKAAATLDGHIADRAPRRRRAPVWITGPAARQAAHELRAAHDAVLVGAGTVLADDPRLTVRLPGARGPAPLRVVLDGRLRTPPSARAIGGSTPTLVLAAAGASASRASALEAAGARVLRLPGRAHRVPLRRVLAALAARDVQSVLVEGGAEVLGAFVEARLVDRVALFVAPLLVGGGVPVATGRGLPVARALRLGPLSVRAVGDDLLLTADVAGPPGS